MSPCQNITSQGRQRGVRPALALRLPLLRRVAPELAWGEATKHLPSQTVAQRFQLLLRSRTRLFQSEVVYHASSCYEL